MKKLPPDIINKIKIRSSLELKLVQMRVLSKCKSFNPKNNFLIFGDPRGGTTWLTELVHSIPKTAICWEPLHIGEVSLFRDLGFGYRQYIPEDYIWPEAKEKFDFVFKGKLITEFTCWNTTPKVYASAEHLIVKFCRGNAMIPWLVNNFEFQYKPIYLVRHPIAVAASQLQQGGWTKSFNAFKIPHTPFNEYYVEHKSYLSSLSTQEEALVAYWCIHNLRTLKKSVSEIRWLTIFYEDLFLQPDKQLQRIEDAWQIKFPEKAFSIRKHSITTVTPVENESQLFKWQSYFTDQQIERMGRVLDYFGCEFYSSKSPLPFYQ